MKYRADCLQLTHFTCIAGNLLEPRKVNAQSFNKLGTPLTFGIKLTPRIAALRQNDQTVKGVIGFDLVIHSEIWIKNLTALPILFGVPSFQLNTASLQDGTLRSSHEPSKKRAAEAALLELSSILEFGDRGHGISGEDGREEIVALPKQQCDSAIG